MACTRSQILIVKSGSVEDSTIVPNSCRRQTQSSASFNITMWGGTIRGRYRTHRGRWHSASDDAPADHGSRRPAWKTSPVAACSPPGSARWCSPHDSRPHTGSSSPSQDSYAQQGVWCASRPLCSPARPEGHCKCRNPSPLRSGRSVAGDSWP